MLVIDAHQDIAWNIIAFGRDYTRSAHETRRMEAESGSPAPARNGDTLLGWPDYRRGKVAVAFSTLFVAPARRRLGDWETQVYADYQQAHRLYMNQLDAYYRLVDRAPDLFQLVRSREELHEVLKPWQALDAAPAPAPLSEEEKAEKRRLAEENARSNRPDEPPQKPSGPAVGLVVLMEGAEGVREPAELELWYQRGVRIVGPAWAGTRYCGGTREPGPLTRDGYALLEVMSSLGMGLDLSHMDEKAALQALEGYPGPLAATHANALALLKDSTSNRHLSNRVIQGIVERNGVIGVVPYNLFLKPGWTTSEGRLVVSLENVAAHIDHICQLAGSARHAGIGSDFDGGFGLQSVPRDVDSVADLQKLGDLLLARGYSQEDTAAILGLNWQKFLERTLPERL